MSKRPRMSTKAPSPTPSFLRPPQAGHLDRCARSGGEPDLLGRSFSASRENLGIYPPLLQPKLTIGQPNDRYELEADRVAEMVMSMGEPRVQGQVEPEEEEEEEVIRTKPISYQISPIIQRQVEPEEEEEEEVLQPKRLPGQITPLVQMQVEPEEEEEEELLQPKRTAARTPEMSPDLGSHIHAPQGGGQPLPEAVRTLFEPRFAYDFSQVRVHTQDRAAESAQALNAAAFTVGQDIVFGSGRYAPDTATGRRLLAHELTHVVQQGEARQQMSRTAGDYLQRMPTVGFTFRRLRRRRGRLDDPFQDTSGNVSWPLSFAVTSPLEAQADVEVTGSRGDPCTSHEIGFLQTVHTQWLHIYYWGRSRRHGSSIVRYTVSLPIRDGDPGSMWYSSTSHAAPTGCNTRVNPSMDDYPTIFTLPKVRTNSLTSQPNYLTGLTRGIHFVTTLVASGPGGVRPLRFFYWNYQMNIGFRPNYGSPNATWPFTWRTNRANLGRIHRGADRRVPIFTTATTPYNQSLTPTVRERR